MIRLAGRVASRAEATIRALLFNGRVEDARLIASSIGGYWNQLLAPPVALSGTLADGDEAGFLKNDAWLSAYGQEERFRNHWVALQDGQLLGADPSRLALHRSLKERGQLKDALFVRLV